MEDIVTLYNNDFKELLRKVKNKKFDIIYLDPPYKTSYIKEAIEEIVKLDLNTHEGIVIAETDEIEKIIEDIKDLEVSIIDKRKYGRAYLLFIQ